MSSIIADISYVTAAEAATQLETTPTRVLMLLKEKALQGIQLDGEWLVAIDSIACFQVHGVDQKEVKGCVTHCSSGGCGCKG